MKASDFKFDPHMKGQKGKESDLQKTVANFLNLNKEVWFHPPNGGKRHKTVAVKLKAEGVKSGVPDVILLSRMCVIELKVNYNKPSLSQLVWLNHFRQAGFDAYWVNSIDEFLLLYKHLTKQLMKKDAKIKIETKQTLPYQWQCKVIDQETDELLHVWHGGALKKELAMERAYKSYQKGGKYA